MALSQLIRSKIKTNSDLLVNVFPYSVPATCNSCEFWLNNGSMGVVVVLKSKMAASSASSGRNSKMIVSFDLSESSNKSPELLLHDPATLEHMLALLPFKFPASGKYETILDSFVTTTTTMNVQAEKALFCSWSALSNYNQVLGTSVGKVIVYKDWLKVSCIVTLLNSRNGKAKCLNSAVINTSRLSTFFIILVTPTILLQQQKIREKFCIVQQ